MIRRLCFLIALFWSWSPVLRAQTTQISNVDFINENNTLHISYDIANSKPTEEYYVWCEAQDMNKSKVRFTKYSGDVRHVKGGPQKKIMWRYQADGMNRDQNVMFRISAVRIPEVNQGRNMRLSTLYPGLGTYKLTGGKSNLVWGAVGWGSVAASLGFAYLSHQNYNDYQQHAYKNLYDKSVNQKKMALYFAGGAAATWLINYAILSIRSHNVRNGAITQSNKSTLIAGTSRLKSLYSKAPSQPPMLSIPAESIVFTDSNGNKRLDANEKAAIRFKLDNKGKGDAVNVTVQIGLSQTIRGMKTESLKVIGNVPKNSSKDIAIPIESSMDLATAKAEFKFTISEGNGFDADPFDVTIPTQAFIAPHVVVADFQFTTETGGLPKLGVPINLKAIVQNVGQGLAKDVAIAFAVPQNIFKTEDVVKYPLGTLQPGQVREINFEFFANKQYTSGAIPVQATLYESYGKYAENKTMEVALNKELAKTTTVEIVGESAGKLDIVTASLSSDVDKNIPSGSPANANRYALVIGNEEYSKYQSGLNVEANVPFAKSDAGVFAQYCEHTLGVPKENITLLSDAISSRMKSEIERHSKLIQYSQGNAEVIVFYAGHGFPDQLSAEPYLIPVDITGSNATEGIRLADLYSKLTMYPAKRVTVFLDACFSGGGRNQGLLAARGIKLVPKSSALSGNMVVFSATSSDQVSLPYKQEQHGMFTYYLLKKLQESAGNVSYDELSEYLRNRVSLQSVKVNGLEQNPEVSVSPDAGDWMNWRLK